MRPPSCPWSLSPEPVLTREDVEELRGSILLRKPVHVDELVDAVKLALYGHL